MLRAQKRLERQHAGALRQPPSSIKEGGVCFTRWDAGRLEFGDWGESVGGCVHGSYVRNYLKEKSDFKITLK